MALKLEEFRLETYDERTTLIVALNRLQTIEPNNEAIEVLLQRLSKTQCQPGGCPYCGGPPEDYDD